RDHRRDHAEARPAVRVAADEAPDDAEQPRACQPVARQVERGVAATRLLQPLEGERSEHESDRDVEPEDPVPGNTVDDRPADERANRDREPADASPDPQRETAPLARNRG